jgi:hypothetical protein
VQAEAAGALILLVVVQEDRVAAVPVVALAVMEQQVRPIRVAAGVVVARVAATVTAAQVGQV